MPLRLPIEIRHIIDADIAFDIYHTSAESRRRHAALLRCLSPL